MFSIHKRVLHSYAALQQRAVNYFADGDVRVRFAPSPTGFLHLGGLRTALYNYLFARSQNGKFLLRIEDTDQARVVPGAAEAVINDLQWCGIEIDEGPLDIGGAHGPYIQSERTKLYTDIVQRLLDNDTAYYCFCTERRLELLRKEALRLRQMPRYDNKCRHLSGHQVAEMLERRMPSCIRFKLSDYKESFNDMIYGMISHNVSQTEGDPIIMKSDHFPTYHFANVVDDHLMKVTHVLRGVEWQISTTKHLMLYRALGWQPPKFGHLPLLVNPDGTKLSKRQCDIGVKHFRERGYFPRAIINYVITAGGGFDQEQNVKPRTYEMQELVQQFNIEKLNSTPSRLNPDLLTDYNRLEIRRMLEDPESLMNLVQDVQALIKRSYPNRKNLDLDVDHIDNVLRWSVNRIVFLSDLTSSHLSFLWVKPSDFLLTDITVDKLQEIIELLQEIEFTKDNLSRLFKDFTMKRQLNFPNLMRALRSALSGLQEGPSVAEMMELLGKDVSLARLNEILQAELNRKPKKKRFI